MEQQSCLCLRFSAWELTLRDKTVMSNAHQELLQNIRRQNRALTVGINVCPKFQPSDCICNPRLCQRFSPLRKIIWCICIDVHAHELHTQSCIQFTYIKNEPRTICRGHSTLPLLPLPPTLTEQVSARETGTKYVLPLSIWLLSSLSGIGVMTISNIQTRGQGKRFKVTHRVITTYTFQTSVQLQIH